jgi:saccharopine dehydrogenase-like NADP-dependent oxidoreductase
MKKILVLGLGKVGTLVGVLLSKKSRIMILSYHSG